MSSAAIRKIWEWIKAMVYKIADLIPGRFKREVQEETEPPVATALEKKLGRAIQKKRARQGRTVDTQRGGSNMPKYQPCSSGHGWKRRKRKTMGGAYYGCRQCGEFFVRAK